MSTKSCRLGSVSPLSKREILTCPMFRRYPNSVWVTGGSMSSRRFLNFCAKSTISTFLRMTIFLCESPVETQATLSRTRHRRYAMPSSVARGDSSFPGKEPWGLFVSGICNYKLVERDVVWLNPPGSFPGAFLCLSIKNAELRPQAVRMDSRSDVSSCDAMTIF